MNQKKSDICGNRELERFHNRDWMGALAELELGDHLCCIYQSEEDHRNLLTHFSRIGLERNEKIIYIVDNHPAETIIEYLRGIGINLNAFITEGQFVILDCERSYIREGIFDPEKMIALLKTETEKALAEGYSGLRVTGEMSWALHGSPGSDRLIEDEIKLNNFFPGTRSLALCQYDQKQFPPEILMDVLRTHPIVVIGTEIYDNFYYIPPEALLSERSKAKEFRCLVESLEKHKQAEKRLKQSERYYRELFESAHDAIIIFSPENEIVLDVNRQACEIYGFSRSEFIGISMMSLSENIPRGKNHIDETLDKGFYHHFETVQYKKDGTPLFLEINASTVNYKGQPAILSINRDITERQRAEEALRKSEEKFRSIYNHTTIGFYRTTPDGEILMANPAAVKMLGYESFEELSERNLEQEGFIPGYSREDFKSKIEKAGGIIKGLETAWERRDGKLIYIRESTRTVTDKNGNILYYEGTIEDITERKEAEEETKRIKEFYELILETVHDGIWVTDKNDVIYYANSAMTKVADVPKEQIINYNIFHDFPQETISEFIVYYQRAKNTLTPVEYETKVVTPSGKETIQQGWLLPLLKDGKFNGIICSIHDITERKKAEEALKKSERKLREANATKDKFFSIISHDLKGGYNVILTGASLLQRIHFAEEEVNQTISTLYKTAENQFELLENLLTWSRLQSDKITCNPSPTDISNLTKYVVYLTKPVAEAKDISIESTFEDDLIAYFDHNMIETVIRNLISNAIKFTNPGGKIEVSIEEKEKSVELSVSDNGVGIEAEDLVGLFRIDSDRQTRGTRDEKGTGLGLILCKEFIEKNNGKIWVESEKGIGSTFRIQLPKRKACLED